MTDRIHCIKKTLRLMPQEAKVLAEKAASANMNEAEYLRFLISQKPKDYPEIRMLISGLTNEINAVGNNINQIVRNHNSRIYRFEDRDLLIAYMKKLNMAMADINKRLQDLE